MENATCTKFVSTRIDKFLEKGDFKNEDTTSKNHSWELGQRLTYLGAAFIAFPLASIIDGLFGAVLATMTLASAVTTTISGRAIPFWETGFEKAQMHLDSAGKICALVFINFLKIFSPNIELDAKANTFNGDRAEFELAFQSGKLVRNDPHFDSRHEYLIRAVGAIIARVIDAVSSVPTTLQVVWNLRSNSLDASIYTMSYRRLQFPAVISDLFYCTVKFILGRQESQKNDFNGKKVDIITTTSGEVETSEVETPFVPSKHNISNDEEIDPLTLNDQNKEFTNYIIENNKTIEENKKSIFIYYFNSEIILEKNDEIEKIEFIVRDQKDIETLIQNIKSISSNFTNVNAWSLINNDNDKEVILTEEFIKILQESEKLKTLSLKNIHTGGLLVKNIKTNNNNDAYQNDINDLDKDTDTDEIEKNQDNEINMHVESCIIHFKDKASLETLKTTLVIEDITLKNHKNVVLFGRTRSGKSAFLKTLGKDFLPPPMKIYSSTRDPELKSVIYSFKQNDKIETIQLKVLDTPGFYENSQINRSNETLLNLTIDKSKTFFKGKEAFENINVILIFLSADGIKEEDLQSIETVYKNIYKQGYSKDCKPIFVITRSENFDEEEKTNFKQQIQNHPRLKMMGLNNEMLFLFSGTINPDTKAVKNYEELEYQKEQSEEMQKNNIEVIFNKEFNKDNNIEVVRYETLVNGGILEN